MRFQTCRSRDRPSLRFGRQAVRQHASLSLFVGPSLGLDRQLVRQRALLDLLLRPRLGLRPRQLGGAQFLLHACLAWCVTAYDNVLRNDVAGCALTIHDVDLEVTVRQAQALATGRECDRSQEVLDLGSGDTRM